VEILKGINSGDVHDICQFHVPHCTEEKNTDQWYNFCICGHHIVQNTSMKWVTTIPLIKNLAPSAIQELKLSEKCRHCQYEVCRDGLSNKKIPPFVVLAARLNLRMKCSTATVQLNGRKCVKENCTHGQAKGTFGYPDGICQCCQYMWYASRILNEIPLNKPPRVGGKNWVKPRCFEVTDTCYECDKKVYECKCRHF
jgi:hypothetical protein